MNTLRTDATLADELMNVVLNAEEHPDPAEDPFVERLDGLRVIEESEMTGTSLLVDRSEVPVRRLTYEGYVGVEPTIGQERLFVHGFALAEHFARELVMVTELSTSPNRPSGPRRPGAR